MELKMLKVVKKRDSRVNTMCLILLFQISLRIQGSAMGSLHVETDK